MPTKEEEEQARQTRMNFIIVFSLFIFALCSGVYGTVSKDNREFWPEWPMDTTFGGDNFDKNLIPVSMIPGFIVAALFFLFGYFVFV